MAWGIGPRSVAWQPLSPREREVLAALSLGLDNRMIARDRTHAVVISLGMAADLGSGGPERIAP